MDTKDGRSPLFHMRMEEEMLQWLRDYSKRTQKPMSAIIKEYLFELWHKDEHAPRRTQQEAES